MNVRRTGLLLPLLIAVVWVACDATLTTIEIEEESSATIPEGTLLEDLLGNLGFDSFLDMDITQAEELQNQGVQDEDIHGVYLTQLELEVSSPAGGDFSFLESVNFYVEAPDLDRVHVASCTAFTDGGSLVSFDLMDVDLHDYVVSESMTLTSEVTGHRPDDETTVEARFALDIEVTVQGACNAIQEGS